MSNKPINQFIQAIKEWDENRNGNGAADLQTLLFILNYGVGVKYEPNELHNNTVEDEFNKLESRVIELSEKQGISQVIIVEGLIAHLSRYFARGMHSVVDNLQMKRKFQEQGKEELANKMFEKFETLEYTLAIEWDEITWNKVVTDRLNARELRFWENDKMLEESKKYKFLQN